MSDLIDTSLTRLAEAAPPDIEAVRTSGRLLIAFSDEVRHEASELKRFLYQNLYRHHRVHRMTSKAKRVVREMFEAFMDDPRLMPPEFHDGALALERSEGSAGRARIVADYVAGMTDRYALDEYERLFDPRRLV